MKQRARKGRLQWERLIQKQVRSGLSVREFCEKESVGTWSFYQWRQRLSGSIDQDVAITEERNESVGAFIDVGSIASADISKSNDGSPWMVTLDLGAGMKLTLQRG